LGGDILFGLLYGTPLTYVAVLIVSLAATAPVVAVPAVEVVDVLPAA
jgi:hypothetical protein